ncbi:MAG: hypothetical protein MMC33_004113, partial [Icmadophila ericetorum]|nr:hypothetical protein [Icmadophila ericetorum]
TTGITPLMWAARRGDLPALITLLQAGAQVNEVDEKSWSALIYASKSTKNGTSRCIKALLEAGANPTHTTHIKCNALHLSAAYQDDENAVALLVEAGTDINVLDSSGAYPLMYAATHDRAVAAQTLLDHGANLYGVDNDGDSLLNNAIFYQAHNISQLLLQRGADYRIINLNGETVLHFAARYAGHRALEILKGAELVKLDIERRNNQGKTALEISKERLDAPDGFVEAFEALLNDIRTRNAEEALHQAENGNATVNETLLSPETSTHSSIPPRLRKLFRRPLMLN